MSDEFVLDVEAPQTEEHDEPGVTCKAPVKVMRKKNTRPAANDDDAIVGNCQ